MTTTSSPEPEKKKGMLTDDEGNTSSMRIMSLLCVVTAIGLGIAYAFQYAKAAQTIDLVFLFLVAGLMPKLLQKVVEKWGGLPKSG